MTCTDYFSKWPEATALKTKDADGVAAFLYQLMTRHGVANIVMSDQGREFVASVNKTLFELTGTDHRISSAYHPQTNGLDERMNQTLTKSLLKLVNVNKDNWDLLIDPVLFAYRTSKHDSTKYTPFFMMYKREAKLPIELAIPSRPEEGESTTHELSLDETIEHMTKLKNEIKSKASSNIEKAQERQKKNYDKKHKPVEFEVGDKVLLQNSRDDARKGGKLQAPCGKGTYTIAECLPKNLYRLKNEQDNVPSKK